MKSNLCLQPIGPANDQRLGVGTCVSGEQQVFMCGNPDSPNLRFSLFPGFPTPMRMYLEFDQTTYLPSYVAMVTVPANHMHLNREYFETIIVAANANMDSPQTTDKPVCSYSCGGLVTDEISS
uniref:Uncharacterized protein n=1 Tax=Ciona savignyi TaxID=51511 RepID=H2YV02_CIOSA